VAPEPNANLTLQQAYLTAQARSCEECVRLDATPEREESASRGLVAFDVRDVPPPTPGPGAIMLVGFDGTSWGVFATYQNLAPPSQLPADIWICVDDSGSNVRSGPGLQYPVLATVDSDQTVPAMFFRLTSEKPLDESAGEGWFLIEGQGLAGWVSSTRVADVGCGLWRESQQAGS
jgi:hypothetical protein